MHLLTIFIMALPRINFIIVSWCMTTTTMNIGLNLWIKLKTYYFTIEAINENGVSQKFPVIKVE